MAAQSTGAPAGFTFDKIVHYYPYLGKRLKGLRVLDDIPTQSKIFEIIYKDGTTEVMRMASREYALDEFVDIMHQLQDWLQQINLRYRPREAWEFHR
jgi:hypothetical protein